MHLKHDKCVMFLKMKPNTIVYTSLRYRDDLKRRALGLLSKEGYYIKIGRFTYKRTNKTLLC